MRAETRQVLPLARTEQLVVQELPGELLIYDLDRHKAHCLNQASAAVWKRCDGKTTVAEMTRLLERELFAPAGDDVVWLALRQLCRFHLLVEGNEAPAVMKVSRRDLVRKYLPATLALPLIISIASPAAAQAASKCAGPCESCEVLPCCGDLNCDGICFPCGE